MFDLDKYLADLILNCRSAFGERLLYMGLQGSWLRGEAHENSDIDIMVILDGFSVRDMDLYRGILKEIGFYEKSCGFICGKDEMKCWNPLEVCQLCQTTKDLVGVLIDYLPPATRKDEINYVKLSLGNLYHELCHRYIHADREKNNARFRGTCKSVFYLIQNLHFLESGHFILSRKDICFIWASDHLDILGSVNRTEPSSPLNDKRQNTYGFALHYTFPQPTVEAPLLKSTCSPMFQYCLKSCLPALHIDRIF